MPYKAENIVRKGEIACSSNFSFSHNVFHSCISVVRQNAAFYGNGLKQIQALKPTDSVFRLCFDVSKSSVRCFKHLSLTMANHKISPCAQASKNLPKKLADGGLLLGVAPANIIHALSY